MLVAATCLGNLDGYITVRRDLSQLKMFCDDADDATLEGHKISCCQHLHVSLTQPATYGTTYPPMVDLPTRSLQNAYINVGETLRVQLGCVRDTHKSLGGLSNPAKLNSDTSGNKVIGRLCQCTRKSAPWCDTTLERGHSCVGSSPYRIPDPQACSKRIIYKEKQMTSTGINRCYSAAPHSGPPCGPLG